MIYSHTILPSSPGKAPRKCAARNTMNYVKVEITFVFTITLSKCLTCSSPKSDQNKGHFSVS